MPATVTHMRMPDSNRVPVSSSLRTHAIWRDSVGYDPYAPQTKADGSAGRDGAPLRDKGNELFILARLTGNVATRTPGACPKCKQVGHLAYQCRNMMSASQDTPAEAGDAFQRVKQREEEEDDQRLRAALGIASDSEEDADDRGRQGISAARPRAKRPQAHGAETAGKKKRKRTRKSSSDSSTSSSSSSSSSSSDSSSSDSSSSNSSDDEKSKKKRKRRAAKKRNDGSSRRAKKSTRRQKKSRRA